MKKTVAFRLSIKFMIIVASIVLMIAMLFVFVLQLSIRNTQSRDLIFNANLICSELENQENPVMDALPLEYYISYVIYNEQNEILFTNDYLLPQLKPTAGKAKKYFQKDFYSDGNLNILYYSAKLSSGITVQTSMDIDQDSSIKMVNTLPKVIIIDLIPILLISFLLSFLITKQTLKPVAEITKSASKITSSNLNTLLPVSKNDDELDNLAKTFNTLFENLKKDFDRETQFTSDVSHELKTPVAGILGQANLLKRWGKDDPKQLEESIELIINEANSMNSIITNLLQSTKLEKGIIKPVLSEVNMWGMFSRLKNEFAVIAPAVKVVFDENIDVCLNTDMELLHQVLTSVISNSVKYGGTVVELKVDCLAEGIQLCVTDNGPGFKEEILPHVFERFFRGDESHTRSAGGAGLGLSIASTIIKTLSGTISARNCKKHAGAEIVIIFK